MEERKLIAIIGAGVIGLQIACTLLEAGYRVTILAQHYPGDQSINYTSPWAGAHWRSYAENDDYEQHDWDLQTFRYWQRQIELEERDDGPGVKSGLGLCECLEYGVSSLELWYDKHMPNFKQIPTSDLPKGISEGYSHTSIMINAPMYLAYLLHKVKALGATTVQYILPTSTLEAALDAAESHIDQTTSQAPIAAFVNATGLSAGKLVPDLAVYPIRGLTVLVRGTASKCTTVQYGAEAAAEKEAANIGITYVLPRPRANETVVGGTKLVGNWDAEAYLGEVEAILARAKEFAPELLNAEGKFNVISAQVGLRPGRKGGARVEMEIMDGRRVCHAYGHSGAGYQNSIGVAGKVLKLVNESFVRG
ncbi:nucleotide-binding domain-containing protein [Microthyrium microscopicum]|uniref:Nucleotide-binding domain-containing protein n=1 Tax=Microthyrium microscopicum TaxID=703497 RepID=A0A6A6UUU7_9PEZI|nr:nucleotide-binding domain-containing protein [Microthyrium microscopicum]